MGILITIGIYIFYAITLFKPSWLEFISFDIPEIVLKCILFLLGIALYAIIILMLFVVMSTILNAIINAVNNRLFKVKIRLQSQMLFSSAISAIIICMYMLDVYYVPYSSYLNDKRLKDNGVCIILPPYEITYYYSDYTDYYGYTDKNMCYVYNMYFKDEITSQLACLDSLCNSSENWCKYEDAYLYEKDDGQGGYAHLVIYPKSNHARFSTTDIPYILPFHTTKIN